jgi:hypothetical protein
VDRFGRTEQQHHPAQASSIRRSAVLTRATMRSWCHGDRPEPKLPLGRAGWNICGGAPGDR